MIEPASTMKSGAIASRSRTEPSVTTPAQPSPLCTWVCTSPQNAPNPVSGASMSWIIAMLGNGEELDNEAGFVIRAQEVAEFVERQPLHLQHDLQLLRRRAGFIEPVAHGADTGPIVPVSLDLPLRLQTLLERAHAENHNRDPDYPDMDVELEQLRVFGMAFQ